MRHVVVCQSRSHAILLQQALDLSPDELTFVVESVEIERFLKRVGVGQVISGSLRQRALYRRVLPAPMLIVSLRDPKRLKGVLDAIEKERGETPTMVVTIGDQDKLPFQTSDYPWAHFVPAGERFSASLRADMRLARAKNHVRHLRELLGDGRHPLIVLQDDPDPDALASGLALRMLLGRNRASMPLGSFGKVTRPENLEMMRVLDLPVVQLTREGLADYDRIFMVDTQPPHLRETLPRVDGVIDHHPAQTNYEARYMDVRNTYGATATILTEYLRADGTKITERLATALLYAIRTDTLWLEQPVSEADVEAFTWLYPRANINQLRRIERPSLPEEMLPAFAEGLRTARIEERVIVAHLGPVTREDVIPQMADFCLQVGGVEWSAVSGEVGAELIVSIRNVGFVQKAGSVAKGAFQDLGNAGGRRSMAKAVIARSSLESGAGERLSEKSYREIERRFMAAVRSARGE